MQASSTDRLNRDQRPRPNQAAPEARAPQPLSSKDRLRSLRRPSGGEFQSAHLGIFDKRHQPSERSVTTSPSSPPWAYGSPSNPPRNSRNAHACNVTRLGQVRLGTVGCPTHPWVFSGQGTRCGESGTRPKIGMQACVMGSEPTTLVHLVAARACLCAQVTLNWRHH
jgi:hypothetical protein